MKKLLLASAVSALMAVPGLASAHGSCTAEDMDHCAYWHDSGNVYVKDGSGRCVRTSSWSKGTQVEGCDEIIKQAPPAPKPVMVPPPAPVAVPPADMDGDGVVDAADQCPATPKGAGVDRVGCPLDSDRDGVADYKDSCPGTAAGVSVDSKGCEVVKYKAVSVNLNVQFGNNSADVESAYATQMQALAYVLKADPSSTVTIKGHTDSLGAADYNQQLSQRRAEAVAKYMIDNYGVAASQVKAVGYGESQPVADNATAAGRAKNRRVEAEVSGKVKQ